MNCITRVAPINKGTSKELAPESLSVYGFKKESIPKLVAQLEQHGMVELGEKQDVTPEVSKRFLELSF